MMTNATKQIVFDRVRELYHAQIIKETFNGIKLQEIDQGLEDVPLHAAIAALVNERKIDVISSKTQLMPLMLWG